MKIKAEKYQEAYSDARKVESGRMRVTDARDHLAALGINRNSALDFIYIFRHMLKGEVYKRAMSADATEYFITSIRRDYGDTAFKNAVTALRLHIPYHGGTMNKHLAVLEKFDGELVVNSSTPARNGPVAVRILPMSPDESSDYSIEEIQDEYFLDELPRSLKGVYRCKNGLNTERGTVVLFQYRNHLVASATFLGSTRFTEPDADGYTGALQFARASIRVFAPVDSVAVGRIWPNVERFSHVRFDLAPNRYAQFEALLSRVRIPDLLSEEGDQPGGDLNDTYAPGGSDSREKVQREIRQRRGQNQFRNALRKRYGDQCMVTRCAVLAILEAAHICPYRGEPDNHPENGLLLRSDIHTLFDLDLIGIEPNHLHLELHPGIEDEFRELRGKKLGCKANRPSKSALELRYKAFSQRIRSPL